MLPFMTLGKWSDVGRKSRAVQGHLETSCVSPRDFPGLAPGCQADTEQEHTEQDVKDGDAELAHEMSPGLTVRPGNAL